MVAFALVQLRDHQFFALTLFEQVCLFILLPRLSAQKGPKEPYIIQSQRLNPKNSKHTHVKNKSKKYHTRNGTQNQRYKQIKSNKARDNI